MRLFSKKLSILLIIILLITISISIFSQTSEYVYYERFIKMWQKIHADRADGKNYFSPEGAPYHAIETMIIEAPDHGHESTSEAYSFWIWLEAMYARLTGDFSELTKAWETMNKHIIPGDEDQINTEAYDPTDPADHAPEALLPSKYPTKLDSSIPVGVDPISADLADTYGTWDIYQMHWLLDCDNFYGYGNRGDSISKPSYINTFQRGPQESTWETIPHPSWELFNWGGENGFLPFFIEDSAGYKKQWRFTSATDADARAIQAMLWAYRFADELGLDPESILPMEEIRKMGDYLRLSFFDKYFKKIGAQDINAEGTGYDSAHYLLSWYIAWGGSANPAESWSWRISSSFAHFGYQNPVAAYALSQLSEFEPATPGSKTDWEKSFQRQVEFYKWLQSKEGAIAGGATNNYMVENPDTDGEDYNYYVYPVDGSTFYGMLYDEKPVYHDPPSNQWFGMQAWSMERMCELYYLVDNTLIEKVVEKWINWVKNSVKLIGTDSYEIPNELAWSGQPDTWDTDNPGANDNLSVTIVNYGQDPGITACVAKALIYYAAGTRRRGALDDDARELAKQLLDRMWNFEDDFGIGVSEERGDYLERFFDQEVYVPDNYSGTMANGDSIEPGATFFSIRSEYENDENYQYLLECYQNGTVPKFIFHRFWHQADVAMAMAEYAIHFDGIPEVKLPPVIEITSPEDGTRFLVGGDAKIDVEASDYDGSIDKVELYITGQTDPIVLTTAPYTHTITNIQEGLYTIKAIATDNDGLSSEDEVNFEVSEVAVGPIKVLYSCETTDINTQQINAHISILNDSDEDINLQDLKVRYYYNRESDVAQVFNCYHAAIGSDNVLHSFKETNELQYYLELGFNSVNLPAHTETGEIQISLNNIDWALYNQSNDWSFNPDLTNYNEWYKITIYKNNELIWGLPDEGEIEYKLILTSPSSGEKYLTGDDIIVQAEVISTDTTHTPIVSFFQNDVEIGSDDTAPYQITVSDIAIGDYTFYASSISPQGNAVQSESVTISVEDPYINGSLVIIPDASEIIPGDDVELRVTPDTNISGEINVEFYLNNTLLDSVNTAPYNTIMSNIQIGSYDVYFVLIASNGMTATTDTISFEVIDQPYLNVNITSPTDNEEFEENEIVTVLFDIDTNQTVSTTKLYLDDVLVMEDSIPPYDLSFTATSDAVVKVEVVAGTLTDSDLVNINVAIPQKPIATILSPNNSDIINLGEPIEIQVEATDADGNISEVKIYDVVGSTEILLKTLQGQTGNDIYSFIWDNVALGEHIIKTIVTDNDSQDSDQDEVIIEVVEGTTNLTIEYEMNSWPSGMSVNITVTNNSEQDINDWVLTWDFPNDQEITSMWNADYIQDGKSVEVSTSLDWNKSIPKGSSRNICGFTGMHSGINEVPLSFYLNGIKLEIIQ